MPYSRTARTPPPRSADFVPSRLASSSASVRSSVRGRRGRSSASASSERACARVEPLEQRQDLVADQPALRVRVGRVLAVRQPVLVAVGARLLAPDAEQRPHDAVLALRLDPLRRARTRRARAARTRPGRRRCGRSRAAGRSRRSSAARAARPRSASARRRVDHLGAEAPRGRSARPRPTRRRAGRGRRGAPRRVAELARARARGRSSRRRRRRGTVTAPPGSISPRSRMKASTRCSTPVVSRSSARRRAHSSSASTGSLDASSRVSRTRLRVLGRVATRRTCESAARVEHVRAIGTGVGDEQDRLLRAARAAAGSHLRTELAISPRCSPPCGASRGPRSHTHSTVGIERAALELARSAGRSARERRELHVPSGRARRGAPRPGSRARRARARGTSSRRRRRRGR